MTTESAPTRPPRPVKIDLALQGGGSHGAFTWGVLDALLQDESIDFDGISGTSAGALNAAVLATGLAHGGREAARRALRAFWSDVGTTPSSFGIDPFSAGNQAMLNSNPAYEMFNAMLRSVSPYQFNPMGINPLRGLLERHVDVPALRDGGPSLFVNATSVTTGQSRVFTRDDLSIDALLASACLPQLFQAVVIDGEPYWDAATAATPRCGR
jgi:NTE family protein